uniref:AcidPPc domain-containing protein n=1 Tax=Elaeophora elaphi TaxID=1147741 RepID=A0A0R3RYG1_9BILA
MVDSEYREWTKWDKSGRASDSEFKYLLENHKGKVLVQTQLWIWDREITSLMILNTVLDSQSNLRFIFLCMEWSLHGGLWLVFSSFVFLVSLKYNFSVNTRYKLAVLICGECFNILDNISAGLLKPTTPSYNCLSSANFQGLCVDLVIVGIIKGIVRRSRPPFNIKDQLYEAPLVDKFSFPSGHSSRGAMLSVLCLTFCSLPHFITPVVKLFPFILGASRICIGRHYISDVMMGLLLGYAEGKFVQYLPLHTVNLLKQIFIAIFGGNEQRHT